MPKLRTRRLHGTEAINFAEKPDSDIKLYCKGLCGPLSINEALLICLEDDDAIYCDIDDTMPHSRNYFASNKSDSYMVNHYHRSFGPFTSFINAQAYVDKEKINPYDIELIENQSN